MTSIYSSKVTSCRDLILGLASQQWKLLLVSFTSAVFVALSEGLTLGILFLAVEALTSPSIISTLPAPLLTLLGATTSPTILVVVLMLLAVFAQLVQSVMRYINKVSIGYFSSLCKAKIYNLIHTIVLSFSFPCASRFKIGELTTYEGVAPAAVQLQIETFADVIVSVLVCCVYIFVLVSISPWLLVAAIALASFLLAVQRFLKPKLQAGSLLRLLIEEEVSARSIEDFQGLRLLHTTGQINYATDRMKSLMLKMERIYRSQCRKTSIVDPLSSLLPILAAASLVIISLLLFPASSQVLLPSLVTFVLALQRLNTRIAGIVNAFNGLAENTSRLQYVDKLLNQADKQYRQVGGLEFNNFSSTLQFKDVCLSYANDENNALSDISFSISRGEVVALVGTSGAGKSSIADLLCRLYQPSSGGIYLDGKLLDSYDPTSWQRQLGVVSQDTFLFNASIADNISFGSQNVTPDLIRFAARQAQAEAFIDDLPDGFNTLVGERGYRLSGGQRQRLSLARAFLRNPKFLILDEATSALDTKSERLVQQAIQNFQGDSTVLVIAHRLSTIVQADLILVLDKGHIIQRGTHNELVSIDGLYRTLWLQQSQVVTR